MIKAIKINKEIYIASAVIISALFLSLGIVVQAQTGTSDSAQAVSVPATVVPTVTATATATQEITFPIAELGSCRDKQECKNYCNQPANMDACIAFAKAHGIMNKEEADRAVNFKKILQSGGGPGGCSGPEECRAFCSNINNIGACVNFAKSNNLKKDDDEEFSKAEKIAEYVKNGGQTPGGCTTKESCSAYCGDFSHAQECYDFAQKSGINQVKGQAKGIPGGIPLGQFQKFLELTKNGQTPGGCKSKDECENYCRNSTHTDECVKFGREIGAISSDQAERLMKLGGKGPGGCTSQESCSAYCNEPSHRDECFKFAEDNGFIPKEQIQQMKDGLTQMLMGLSQMPPEVAACVKSALGVSGAENVQSSQIVPGPEISDRIKDCFEKFGHREKENAQKAFKNMPESVKSCLEQKLGDRFSKIVSGEAQPSPSDAEVFRACNQQQIQTLRKITPDDSGRLAEFLKNAPPAFVQCVKKKLGEQADGVISGRQKPSSDDVEKINGCFNEVVLPMQAAPMSANGQRMMQPAVPNKLDLNNLPPAVAECVKKLSGGDSENISASNVGEILNKCLQQIGRPAGTVPGLPNVFPTPVKPPLPPTNIIQSFPQQPSATATDVPNAATVQPQPPIDQ